MAELTVDDVVPMGYRFAPTDQEIIYFLTNLATYEQTFSKAVVEKNVYESEPWNIFSNKDKWVSLKDVGSKNKYMYVHTRVNYIGNNIDKKNISRKAGQGSWSGKSKVKSIADDSGKVIGYMRSLTYKVDGDDKENRKSFTKKYGHWMMHEYMIDEGRLPKSFKKPCDFVICKITKQEAELDEGGAITSEDDTNKRECPPREDVDHVNNKRMKRGIDDNIARQQDLRFDVSPKKFEGLHEVPSTGQKFGMPNNSYAYHPRYPGPVMQENLGTSDSQSAGIFPPQFQPSIPTLAARPDAWLNGCFANGITNIEEFPYPIQSVPNQCIPTYQPLENFSVEGVVSTLPSDNVVRDDIGDQAGIAAVTEEGIGDIGDQAGIAAVTEEGIGDIGDQAGIAAVGEEGIGCDEAMAKVLSEIPEIPTDLWQNIDFHALENGGTPYPDDGLGLIDFDFLFDFTDEQANGMSNTNQDLLEEQ